MIKNTLIIILCILSFSSAFSQYKKNDNKLNKSTNNLILGIFNPKNFSMKQSFQVSMLSSKYGSNTLTSLVNSMNYKFSDKLSVSADVKLQYSPYSSSIFGSQFAKNMQNDMSGIFLSRVSMDYKLSENSFIKFEYRNLNDGSYYNGMYNPLLNNDEILR
ncbi:MAG: hypothetical protein HY959_10430 [Ignavibacteriae bacterium]|nr:hypothetical protein [Ignavibacteriota bacterium]